MAERKETVVLEFIADTGASIESIESLTKANKTLRDERNKLNLQSAEGQKRAKEINALLDQNTTKIKTNVSALEQQKINIGNYKSALDNVIPGLSGFIDKGTSATKTVGGMSTAMKLLLGPVGLIVLAFAAVVKWFTSTEEGGDKLAIIMAKLGAFVNVLSDRFTQLGGAIANFSWEGIKEAFSGIGDEINNEVVAATDLAERLDILDELNLALNIRLSEQQNLIKNLIIQSKNRSLTEEERTAKLVEASRIEKQLTGEQIALRVAALHGLATQIQLENSAHEAAQRTGETAIEFAKRLAANQSIDIKRREEIEAQLRQYNGLLAEQSNVQEKIQNQQDALADKIAENEKKRLEAIAKQNEELAKQSEIERQLRISRLANELKPENDNRISTEAKVSKQIGQNLQKDLAERQKAYDDFYKAKNAKAAQSAKYEEDIERRKYEIITDLTSSVAGLMREDSIAQRGITSAMTLVNTYAAAMAAYKSGAEINVFFGVAAAAAAITAGLANVAKINGIQFAEGGWTGPGDKYQAVGIVHADEYVTPKRVKNLPQAQPHIAALEGMRLRGYADGGLVANSISQPINSQFDVLNVIKNLPPVQASWSEGKKVGRRLEFKERISKR
jgi:hypothetical protein